MQVEISRLIAFVAHHQHYLLAGWATFFVAKTLSFIAAQPRPVEGWTLSAAAGAIFPRNLWASRSSWFDMFMFVFERLIAPVLSLGELAAMTLVATRVADLLGSAHGHPLGELTGMALVGCAVLGFVISDLAGYVAHFLMHHVPALWEIHKVHHSASVLSPLTASRSHPIERKVNSLVNCLLSGMFFGLVSIFFNATIDQLLIAIALTKFIFDVMLLDAIRHSDLKISFGVMELIFVSPRVHQLHHSSDPRHWNRNIGIVMSLWDHLFGTFHKVENGQSFHFGTGEGAAADDRHNGFRGGLIEPVVRMVEVAIGKGTRPGEVPRGASPTEIAAAHGTSAD